MSLRPFPWSQGTAVLHLAVYIDRVTKLLANVQVPVHVRHSGSRPVAARSTDIRIECSANACLCQCCLSGGRRGQLFYTLRRIFMARVTVTGRDY